MVPMRRWIDSHNTCPGQVIEFIERVFSAGPIHTRVVKKPIRIEK